MTIEEDVQKVNLVASKIAAGGGNDAAVIAATLLLSTARLKNAIDDLQKCMHECASSLSRASR